MSTTVDRDKFINELNERVIGLTLAQAIMISALAGLSDDFAGAVEKRICQAVETIPENMRTPVIMAQIDNLLASIGRGPASKRENGMPPYLRIIRGGKEGDES